MDIERPDTKVSKAYYVGLHQDSFQCGAPAEILGVVMYEINPYTMPNFGAAIRRACLHLRYPNGQEDYAPLEDVKKYKIVSGYDLRPTKGRT